MFCIQNHTKAKGRKFDHLGFRNKSSTLNVVHQPL